MSTFNLCFEQKYEKISELLSEKFSFFGGEIFKIFEEACFRNETYPYKYFTFVSFLFFGPFRSLSCLDLDKKRVSHTHGLGRVSSVASYITIQEQTQ